MDNCNLQEIPDVSNLKQLAYLDVSNNSVTNLSVTNWLMENFDENSSFEDYWLNQQDKT